LGLILTSNDGRSMGYFPAVGTITEELRERLESVDLLLFDGTFWSEDELIQVQGSGQRARDMGHIPVGGEAGSLRQLTGLRTMRKLYIHINNTNPMLNEAGPEYRALRAAGWNWRRTGGRSHCRNARSSSALFRGTVRALRRVGEERTITSIRFICSCMRVS